jgi:putative endonuclease
MQSSFVYIMASAPNGTLYVGMTNDLIRRVYEHRESVVPGFTDRYAVKRLGYYEIFNDIRLAKARESRLKHWKRDWKIALIQRDNPDWRDLYPARAGE